MLSFTVILQELSTTMLAAGTGLVFYKRLNRFNRILLLQVIIYIVIDITSLFYVPNNSFVFNLYMPLEVALLLLAARNVFETTLARSGLLITFTVFMVVYLIDIFVFTGFSETLVYHAAITEGILLTVIFLVVVYISFMRKGENALALAAIGMIVYFACTIPFLGNLFYFEYDPELNDLLYRYLVVLPAFLRYFFIALAFFIQVYGRRSGQTIKEIAP